MSESLIIPSAINGFRVSSISFACVLAGLAGWILAAEVVRPPDVGIATTSQSNILRRHAAVLAAHIGLVRGDLWSRAAFAYADPLWAEDRTSNADVAPFEQTKAITEQAIARAPHNSRLWLLLAGNYFHFGQVDERATAALKMSYYTGSNTIAVLPQRLLMAIQSGAFLDDELGDLVRHDIRTALMRKSQLMPAVVAAHNAATTSGRQFIEKTLGELDPSALAAIRSSEKAP
jgi:hypothetical protein